MTGDVGEQAIIERLRVAPKYRCVHVDTIMDIVRQESSKASSTADLERRARLKLHRVVAGYLVTGRITHLARGLADADGSLGEGGAANGTDAARRELCLAVLGAHFSTAERLPDLHVFYPAVLGGLGTVRSIADLACALSPFSLPWLRDVTDADYTGYDLNLTYVELGSAFLAGRYPRCSVVHRDVLVRPGFITADVALVLKTYHNMEDRQPGAGLRLVTELRTPVVVVSFPMRTMSGRPASFTWRLLPSLTSLAADQGWQLDRVELPTELIIIVRKGSATRKGSADGAPA
jgi:16S rRNA (guanine(1405)-N(7))-methyltransferase